MTSVMHAVDDVAHVTAPAAVVMAYIATASHGFHSSLHRTTRPQSTTPHSSNQALKPRVQILHVAVTPPSHHNDTIDRASATVPSTSVTGRALVARGQQLRPFSRPDSHRHCSSTASRRCDDARGQ
jgi:hypothetical protein